MQQSGRYSNPLAGGQSKVNYIVIVPEFSSDACRTISDVVYR
jgi:hypothetical protein